MIMSHIELIECKFCSWKMEIDYGSHTSEDLIHTKRYHPDKHYAECFKRTTIQLVYDCVRGEFIKDIRIRHRITGWHYDRYGWEYDKNGKVIQSAYEQYKREVEGKEWIYRF